MDPEQQNLRIRERTLLRKLDLNLVPLVALLYLICFLDRVNIGNARAVGLDKTGYGDMERALGMTWNGAYNWALSIFFFGYVLFEVPSNLVLKRVTPRVWIARIMVTWGICASALAFANNWAAIMVIRFFLGCCEAGFFPGILFYLSFWYAKKEYTFRVSVFFAASSLAGAFSGLFAYYLSQVQMGYISTWRAIFFWEGVPAILFSGLCYFCLPNFPQTARFLTEEEREFAVERLKKDGIDPTDHSFSWPDLRSTLMDVRVWIYMVLYLTILTPTYGVSFFLPTIIKNLGFSALNAQLLSTPPYILACIVVIAACFSADYHQERSFHLMGAAVCSMVGFFGLAYVRNVSQWVLFTFTCLAVIGAYTSIPLSLGWLSNNYQVSQTKAATAIAMMVGFGNIGGVLGPQIYQPTEAQAGYPRGHTIMGCMAVLTFVLTAVMRFYFQRKGAFAKSAGGDQDATAVDGQHSEDVKTKIHL
ncbi:hypothetical protein HK101_010711 [Irineochytrium annulatum]|nr:hypothetical protein HK101_010711 [Irineochytrium annulatum]